MKSDRKYRQRQEVRKILHAMRLELAAQRVAQEQQERFYTPNLYKLPNPANS